MDKEKSLRSSLYGFVFIYFEKILKLFVDKDV